MSRRPVRRADRGGHGRERGEQQRLKFPPAFPLPASGGPRPAREGAGSPAPRTVPCAAGWHRLCPGPQVGGQAGGAATSKPNPLTVTKSTTAAERGSGLSGCPGGLGARLSLLAHRKLVWSPRDHVRSGARPSRPLRVLGREGPASASLVPQTKRPRRGGRLSPSPGPSRLGPRQRAHLWSRTGALCLRVFTKHRRDDLCVSVAERGRGVLRFGRTSGRRGERPRPTPLPFEVGAAWVRVSQGGAVIRKQELLLRINAKPIVGGIWVGGGGR